MRRTLAVVCALAVMLGGCAGDEPSKPLRTFEPQQTASSPSPKPTSGDSLACKVLTSKDRRSIAGKKLEIVAPVRATKDVHQCRWVDSLASPQPAAVTVLTQRVQVWLRGLTTEIDRLTRSGKADEKYVKRLQAAKKTVRRGTEKIGDREACDLFSLVTEVRYGKKNAKQYVFRPDATSLVAVRCSQGVHTVVSYTEPELMISFVLNQALERLVKTAHQRAVKLL